MEKLPSVIVYMPCIGCIWCVLSFAICFIIAKVLHHLPTWFIFPPISFLGYQMPEHVVYAVCFTAGAVCFFISFLYIQKYSFKIHGLCQTSYASKWLAAATVIALVCPLFLTIQAIIPLQRDILEEGVEENIWSIVHQLSAVVLFFLSVIHASIVNFFIHHTPDHSFAPSSVLLKYIGLFGMVISLIGSVIFHPASNLSGSYVLCFEIGFVVEHATF